MESVFEAFRAAALLKRDSKTDVFCDIAKFLRTPVLKNICERLGLLLYLLNLHETF